jgi:hypothetical protein
VLFRGGNLNNGAYAGPFNVNVNNSFSNANVNNGARVDSSRPDKSEYPTKFPFPVRFGRLLDRRPCGLSTLTGEWYLSLYRE